MAGDWDLYAVVRSCTAGAGGSTDIPIENGNIQSSLDCLGSFTFEDENDPFHFSNLLQPTNHGCHELQDSCKPFLPISSGGGNIIPLSSIYNSGGFDRRHQPPQVAQQRCHLQPPPPPNNTPFSLRFNNMHDLHLTHQNQQQLLHRQHQSSQSTQLPVSRSRKKKIHRQRQVMEVTADNLCNDMWAWRKYGQKPIKGSPYPRNYYRCSSSKGCTARKQVERSNIDPNIFIVSYTDEHTHPRPTHRNSLAGSTRNRYQAALQKQADKETTDEPEKGHSLSPLSVTSLSPTTPLSVSVDHDVVAEPNELIKRNGTVEIGADMEGHRFESDHDEDEFDDDDILIPNITLNEDLIKGLQELRRVGSHDDVGNSTNGSGLVAGGLGRSSDFGDNFSSWDVGSSPTVAGNAGGGG